MSLARAFTTRRQKQPSVDMGFTPQRSNTVARGSGPSGSIRNKISAPMALTHTTNMLAYNAPDLYPQSASTDSSKSDSDSDSGTNMSSPPTSPDVDSAGRSESPEPNHLSCYFTAPGQKLPGATTPAPSIPKRSPSHTKKASYDHFNNHSSTRFSNQSGNSVSTKGSSTLSRSASISTTATSLSVNAPSLKSPVPSLPPMSGLPAVPAARSSASNRKTAERSEGLHPFGQELAQVSEIAEEFGIRDKIQIIDEEAQHLKDKGLHIFRPEDYLGEIQSLFVAFFQDEPEKVQQPVWI